MNALGILLLGGGSALLCFSAGWAVCDELKDRKAEREQAKCKRAEDACEELRKALMRGSSVGHIINATGATELHITTTEGDLILSCNEFTQGRERAATRRLHPSPFTRLTHD